jgi:hypothetical protein
VAEGDLGQEDAWYHAGYSFSEYFLFFYFKIYF